MIIGIGGIANADPGKTIPLSILLSFVAIIGLYVMVPFAVTGTLSRQELGETNMAVVTASQQFLPSILVTVVAGGALLPDCHASPSPLMDMLV